MGTFDRLRSRPWLIIATLAVLLALHGLAFYLLRHLILSATLATAFVTLIAVKHLGLFASGLAAFRKRWRERERKDSNGHGPA